MDLPNPLPNLAQAPTLAQPVGAMATLPGTLAPEAPTDRSDTEPRQQPNSGRRDIVAAVIYYNGARALLKDDEAALRAAGICPPMIGKYPVDRVLGSGGKGAVLLGRNPDLDEEVAIKVLRGDGPGDREREGVRLLREGRILAKLVHPNIVPIHDAGVADGDHYIVMRRARGTTLREAQAGKSWRAIVDLYLQAGAGLAAVHDVGLVHRDFKADNVLVEADGRVMLADFGLVCLIRGAGEPWRSEAHGGAFLAVMTRTGEVHGTPGYMAPEAFLGEAPRVASDVFSFAAALFEGLYGERAFYGENYAELIVAMMAGKIRERPSDGAVPAWLDEVVRGALAAEVSRRPPTMHALLAALNFHARERAEAEGRARTRRLRWFGGAAGVAAIAGVLIGGIIGAANDPCATPAARLEGAWDATVRARVNGMGASGGRLAGLFDVQATAWTDTFSAVCTATHAEGTQSNELLDARMGCLDRRRGELAAIIGGLAEEGNVDEALLAAARLESPRPCAQAERVPQPRADQVQAVAALSAELAGVRVQELGGAYDDGRTLAEELVARARTIGHEPLVAEALVVLGRARWLAGAGAAAREALAEALDLAERLGLDTLAADGANMLTKLAALVLREPALGHEWARQAERKLARTAGDAWRRAELISNRGLVAFELDTDYPQARELHEQALAMRQALQAGGDEARIWIAESNFNLGNVQCAAGDVREGLASYRESRRILVEVLGPEHPRIGVLLHAEATEHMNRGELDEALARGNEALAILEHKPAAALELARVYHLLSGVFAYRSKHDAAVHHAHQALALVEGRGVAHAYEVAGMYDRLGTALRQRGDHAEAMIAFDAGLLALAASPVPSPAHRLALLFNRGDLQVEMGRPVAALADFGVVDEIIRAGGPALAVYRPYLLRGLGAAYLADGRPEAAIDPLREARAALPVEGEAALRADIEWLLAQALPGKARAEARALAEAAGEAFKKSRDDAGAAEVRDWLATNPAPESRAVPANRE